jgi:hypothetical protein
VEDGLFSSESERLLLVDRRDYNTLGLGLDDLIEAFVQTVLAVTAIDHMCTVRQAEEKEEDRTLTTCARYVKQRKSTGGDIKERILSLVWWGGQEERAQHSLSTFHD